MLGDRKASEKAAQMADKKVANLEELSEILLVAYSADWMASMWVDHWDCL